MRLQSLDIFRGLVMLMLVVFQPLLLAADRAFGLPLGLTEQLTHVPWEGCHVWDCVMPFFIFMCGTALPFSLPKYLNGGRPGVAFFLHLLKRVALLWMLGMVVQGNLLDFRWDRLYWYTNTLQAIAAGYVIAALFRLVSGKVFQLAAPLLLMVAYGLLLHFGGDYTPTGNLSIRIDRFCFPCGNGDPMYPWVLPTLMFAAITLAGACCGDWFKGAAARPFLIRLVVPVLVGVGVFGLGRILVLWVPAVKYIWTPSFTLMVLGYAVWLQTLLYAVVDLTSWSRWLGPVVLFGRHSLMAYMLGVLFMPVFAALSRILLHGMPMFFGNGAQPFVLALGNALGLMLALYVWDWLCRKRVE